MGEMNLLRADFVGKVGEMYGARDKKYSVIKAIPFSHTPHNEKQTKSVRAFEKLCRFSSGIASVFYDYMGLSDKKMLRHNAISHFLKIVVANKTFNVSAIAEVIPSDGTCEITTFSVDKEHSTLSVSARTTESVDKENGHAWFLGVFASDGQCVFSVAPETEAFSKTINGFFADNKTYFAVAFRSDLENGKVKLHGWSSTDIAYVVNRRVLIDLFPTSANYSVVGNRLIINDTSVKVENGRVIVEV